VGLTTSDFRWLVCKGYVNHAREITRLGEDGRTFEREGNLTLTEQTCLVLTDTGLRFAVELLAGGPLPHEPRLDPLTHETGFASRSDPPRTVDGERSRPHETTLDSRSAAGSIPEWDRDRQELRLGRVIVKQFKVPAPNQEIVLASFEEESWPIRIDDPLPVHPSIAAKQRLHETITSLNRNQRTRLINFSGDGSGQGVRWEAFSVRSDRIDLH
jgi:hypothetical protein